MQQNKRKHPHNGHRQRFKDKALNGGIEHWPYHEVLELLLMYVIPRKDVNPLAHELIDTFGSFARVLNAGVDQLKKINGVGKEAALFLSLLPDIFDKYNASNNIEGYLLDTPYKCVSYFRSKYKIKRNEEFYVFCLDKDKRLIKTVVIDGGKAASIEFSITDFAEKISFEGHRSMVIMHSHPGGNPTPTMADKEATRRLMSVAATLGITVEDHIIIAESEFYSFLNSGEYYSLMGIVKKSMDEMIKFSDGLDISMFDNLPNK